jgi:hypothetical protein
VKLSSWFMNSVLVPSPFGWAPSPSGIPTMRYCSPDAPPSNGTLSSALNSALIWYAPPTGSTYGFTEVAASPEPATITTTRAAAKAAPIRNRLATRTVRLHACAGSMVPPSMPGALSALSYHTRLGEATSAL